MLLLLAACVGEETVPQEVQLPKRSNVLLVTVDTLRADHLSSYGYPRQTSPVLDRLASEGLRFDQAAVQWPKTGPSFASMLTATYPKDNGIVRRIGIPLAPELRLLAEELKAEGYNTHAVVANGAVGSEFNFDQGFDTYQETWKLEDAGNLQDQNRAEVVNRLAQGVIQTLNPERPFFLWLHYLDPHFPYVPPAEARDRFQNDAWFEGDVPLPVNETRSGGQMRAIGRDQVLDGRRDLGFYLARYDAEIAYVDDQIGKLLHTMTAAGLMKSTLTVVTSDHGESLGEHQYYFDHGRFGFQTCLRVPLILHYPSVLPAGVDRDPVELIHLMPTLLEAAGVELVDGRWMSGRSLTRRLFGGTQSEDGELWAFSEAGYATKRRWQKIVRGPRYKLVFAPYRPDQKWIAGAGTEVALYDLSVDPGEEVNLAAQHGEVVSRMQGVLSDWWQAPNPLEAVEKPDTDKLGEMDDKTREQLEALGYL